MEYGHHSAAEMTTTDSETCRGTEPRPRIAVVVAVRNTYKNSLRGVRKYHGLVIHKNRGFNADPNVQGLLGLIVAEMPQAVRGGRYMALLTYREEVTMIVLDHNLGLQMIDVCLAADGAAKKCDTIDKGYGFGDLTYEIILYLESTAIMLPHIMVASPRRWWNFTRTSATRIGKPYYPLLCTRCSLKI